MKLNILTTTALLAVAAALTTQSAKAQFTGQSGDLVLSFTDTSSSTNYEIDLGSFTQYQGTSQINIANINSDLSSVYGNGWATDSSLTYALLGVVNNGAISGVKTNSLLVSDTGTAYAGETSSTVTGQVSKASAIYTPANDTANPPVDGSTTGSYEVPEANLYSFAKTSQVDGFSTTAPIADSLYLDTIQPGSGLSKGVSSNSAETFSLSSSGEVIYDAQTVSTPEPSTYALCLGGLVLLIALKRRQLVSKL